MTNNVNLWHSFNRENECEKKKWPTKEKKNKTHNMNIWWVNILSLRYTNINNNSIINWIKRWTKNTFNVHWKKSIGFFFHIRYKYDKKQPLSIFLKFKQFNQPFVINLSLLHSCKCSITSSKYVKLIMCYQFILTISSSLMTDSVLMCSKSFLA